MSGRLLYRGTHGQQGSVGGVPKDPEDGGDIPTPQKKAHLGRGVGAIFPEEESVGDEKECAEREEGSDDEIGEGMADEKRIDDEKRGDEEICWDATELRGERTAGGIFGRVDGPDF